MSLLSMSFYVMSYRESEGSEFQAGTRLDESLVELMIPRVRLTLSNMDCLGLNYFPSLLFLLNHISYPVTNCSV